MSTVSGRVWIVGDSVTTDAMYPAFAMKLPVAEAARHVFYELRPGWIDEVRPGDIVVAGKNFGLGSSRPVGSLFREIGVAALIAEEFNSLFHRNCINVGLPALTVPGATTFFAEGDIADIDVETGEYTNRTTGRRGRTTPLPGLVLDILRAGGVMPMLAAQGYLPDDAAAALRGNRA